MEIIMTAFIALKKVLYPHLYQLNIISIEHYMASQEIGVSSSCLSMEEKIDRLVEMFPLRNVLFTWTSELN